MERALRILLLSCAGSAGAAYYAHWQQRTEKARMHEGVVRDLAREAAEAARGLQQTTLDAAAAATEAPCDSGICALAVKRIRVE
jgi:hypothetical protein